jgi:hypothetical protein
MFPSRRVKKKAYPSDVPDPPRTICCSNDQGDMKDLVIHQRPFDHTGPYRCRFNEPRKNRLHNNRSTSASNSRGASVR